MPDLAPAYVLLLPPLGLCLLALALDLSVAACRWWRARG